MVCDERFIDTILGMLEHLPARPEIGPAELPGWADRYCLKSEITAHKEIEGFRNQIETIKGEIQTRAETLWAIERRKVLFTGKGPSLEDAVSVALTELGFKVLPGPKSHADLVCCYEDQIGVWEIKGQDKPTTITDVGQCSRWVSEIAAAQTLSPEERREDSVIERYAEILREMDVPVRESEDEDVEPLEAKGFILVNTHQAKELSERNNPSEPDFPDNVSKAIKRDGHCAMTGVQLLGVLLAGEENPDERPNLARKLFDTKNVLSNFRDWAKFLSDPKEGVADE